MTLLQALLLTLASSWEERGGLRFSFLGNSSSKSSLPAWLAHGWRCSSPFLTGGPPQSPADQACQSKSHAKQSNPWLWHQPCNHVLICQIRLALSIPFSLTAMTCLALGTWTRWLLKVLSNPNCSVILILCKMHGSLGKAECCW